MLEEELPTAALQATGQADLTTRLKVAELAIQRLEAERDRLESLVVKLGALAANLDPRTLIYGVAEAARDLTGAPLAMFAPAPERAVALEPTVVCAEGLLAEVPQPARAPLLGTAIARGAPVRLDDTARWAPAGAESAVYGRLTDGRPLRSWLALPVRARQGDNFGGLFLAHYRAHAFGIREEELAAALAAHLGASLDNAVVFHERSRVARALQQTLLPPVLPEIPGIELAARYRPARSTALVGGDFYDIFESRPGTWSMFVGDVSGVGPEAAALTGIARYAARALASQEPSPAQLLSQLNATLVRFGLQERFCTVLYAELGRQGGEVIAHIANGGHPYPFILRAAGQVEEIEVSGALLGVLQDVTIEQRPVTLGVGDTLVCCTDGVLEARSPSGEQFGVEGVTKILASCSGRPAASVTRKIELAVLEHQSGLSPDDIAIVALRRVE